MTYHNLLKPLPFAPGSVAAVYAGELWEHFEYSQADQLTGYCYEALSKGGVLRVCVPDGPDFFSKYLNRYHEQMALPAEKRSSKPTFDMVHSFFKDICTKPPGIHSMGHYHKWVYDEIQLIEMFKKHGFRDVARAKYHESRIPDVNVLERSDFLIVEGIK